MTDVVYNKLVRDKIPSIIEANGDIPITRTLKQDEFRSALLAKLGEEAEELRSAAPDARIDELADLQEVLDALGRSYGHSRAEVDFVASIKRHKKGAFKDQVFLESTSPQ
ncbi:nucleoside triphosphate pyrophosphohydrolase [Pseudarthrobacter sp. BIM B-2242]|uniref:nucleoside triphosphate pyrophosphohydrolase n=1 Tax=Pseudarthrobacter sp. BIM B-2242 TaxID=2772401 RepID=UPI00168AC9C8|nr:nucleoside triphosphate pyrophosphohydrolase [Pseudarthrobacter sp. BIM B-2242]QOD05655.1 nucleoside triphosphate pyrophosphohydrolase [Pseudarthrobacter sp. BIM B-2242]